MNIFTQIVATILGGAIWIVALVGMQLLVDTLIGRYENGKEE